MYTYVYKIKLKGYIYMYMYIGHTFNTWRWGSMGEE